MDVYPLDFDYDWCVITPRYELSQSYYFDCYTVGASGENTDVVDWDLTGERTFSVGYPEGFDHYMMMSQGEGIMANLDNNSLTMTNCVVDGMSGGPVYITYYGPRVVAINSRYSESLFISWGCLITQAVYNVIVQNMELYQKNNLPRIEKLVNGEWKRLLYMPGSYFVYGEWRIQNLELADTEYQIDRSVVRIENLFDPLTPGRYRIIVYLGSTLTPFSAEFDVIE